MTSIIHFQVLLPPSEIGPSNLLQKILEKNLFHQTVQIDLIRADSGDKLFHLLTQIGRLFNQGLSVQAMKLIVPNE